jgi:catechol 2,3-dioxygenase-like lactoylglutathione lyase family enzyme
MKRFHVHVGVSDLHQSIHFYSTVFGAAPSVRKPDYAKWMLDDPRINFAISHRPGKTGVNHLGLQVDSADELTALHDQLQRADRTLLQETAASCCYAKSDKYWITDPQGVAWETFHSLGAIPVYGDDAAHSEIKAACCVPEPAANIAASACCAGGC